MKLYTQLLQALTNALAACFNAQSRLSEIGSAEFATSLSAYSGLKPYDAMGRDAGFAAGIRLAINGETDGNLRIFSYFCINWEKAILNAEVV